VPEKRNFLLLDNQKFCVLTLPMKNDLNVSDNHIQVVFMLAKLPIDPFKNRPHASPHASPLHPRFILVSQKWTPLRFKGSPFVSYDLNR